jgi:hypothetical protein
MREEKFVHWNPEPNPKFQRFMNIFGIVLIILTIALVYSLRNGIH